MSELGVNLITLLGRVGRDPESRYSQAGTAFSNFSLAISDRRKKGEGYEDYTEWVNCVAIGKTAETIAKHVAKGSRLYLTGKMQTRKWQDKSGADRYTTEVLIRDLVFLGGGKEQSSAPAQQTQGGSALDPPDFEAFDPDQDVPF